MHGAGRRSSDTDCAIARGATARPGSGARLIGAPQLPLGQRRGFAFYWRVRERHF